MQVRVLSSALLLRWIRSEDLIKTNIMDNASAEQLLRDVNVVPTEEIIAEGLGKVNAVYQQFIAGLKENGISLMDWRYYNDGKAWLSKGEYKWVTTRGTNKVKPIFWLSIWRGFFKVSFFFSEKNRDKLLALPVSQEVKNLIKNTIPNGQKMRFLSIVIDVDNEKQLVDIDELIKYRKENI